MLAFPWNLVVREGTHEHGNNCASHGRNNTYSRSQDEILKKRLCVENEALYDLAGQHASLKAVDHDF